MNRFVRPAFILMVATLLPAMASAELRRVEMKTLGMD
jgi:hypothetical protein